jgi:hypothetical protein
MRTRALRDPFAVSAPPDRRTAAVPSPPFMVTRSLHSLTFVALLGTLVGCEQLIGIDDVAPAPMVDAPPPVDAASDVDASIDAAPGAALEATWSLREREQAGVCPNGAEVTALYICPGICPPGATPRIETTACAATGSFSLPGAGAPGQPLEPGLYTVWVRLTDGAGTARFAESAHQPVAIPQDGATQRLEFPIQATLGQVEVSWRLIGAQSGMTLVCTGVGGEDGVSILVTLQNNQAFESVVDCEPGMGLGPLVPIGSHTVALALLRGSQSIGDSAAAPIAVTYGNELVSLGQRTIRVDGL